MQDYLKDNQFLNDLDNQKIKVQYIKLILLDFNECPIKEIQGIASSGTLSVNGSATLRRTINLNLIVNQMNNDLSNIDNFISIDKKIKIEVGYKNLLKKYYEYGDIIWFPCGIYIISSASISRTTSGINISISGKDKMVLLNGTVGGTLPASVTFHERYEYDEQGNVTVTYPTIFQIIQEAVVHYGKENVNNVIITDLSETTKLLVKYNGDTPIYFSDDFNSFIITNKQPPEEFSMHKFSFGQDIGYMETDFTYPGELIFQAGTTVTSLLDKICEVLGNFEYFYNIEGKFVFQEIKNYLNTSYSPLTEINGETYIQNFSNTKYAYSLYDANTVISFNTSPNYDNIKNDFIVWGQKTLSNGETYNIRYHLSIDTKPLLDKCLKYMWPIVDKNTYRILRYAYTDSINLKPQLKNDLEDFKYDDEENIIVYYPGSDWREELYRQALENSIDNNLEGDYDQELIAEWRKLFDPNNSSWETEWNNNFSSKWEGWNPSVYLNPGSLSYWLDFIDTFSYLNKYAVTKIGRRTKVVNNNDIKSIYNTEVPDVIFLENIGNMSEQIKHYTSIGQKFCLLQKNQLDYFSTSSTASSAYDMIRELLYQNLVYNTQITISCQPKYYLEPNNLIYIQDSKSGISGNYNITSYSLPLNYSGTMSINATEALVRV